SCATDSAQEVLRYCSPAAKGQLQAGCAHLVPTVFVTVALINSPLGIRSDGGHSIEVAHRQFSYTLRTACLFITSCSFCAAEILGACVDALHFVGSAYPRG